MPLIAAGNIDVSWVSAVVAVIAGIIGATVGFGRRNQSLTTVQAAAVDAAALRITTLEGENTTLRQETANLNQRLSMAERRIDAAERMATSKDLIIDIATFYGCSEDVLRPYRLQSTIDHERFRTTQ